MQCSRRSNAQSIAAVPSEPQTAREVTLSVSALASFPEVYFAVGRLINDPDSSLRNFAEAQDPVLAAGISRLANSAYFGLASFFHTLKVEAIHGEHFQTRQLMTETVIEYIEVDCNRTRRHSANGYLSPEAFEAQQVT